MVALAPLTAGFAAKPPAGFGAGDGFEAGGAATGKRAVKTAAQYATNRATHSAWYEMARIRGSPVRASRSPGEPSRTCKLASLGR
jgi:hypothetical protein